MPIYKYYCKEGDKTFEVGIPMSQAPLKKCIKCEKENCLDRVWEGKGIGYINKSGGFYSDSNL